MALAPDSTLETVSFVLTKDQVRRLRAIHELQRSNHRRLSMSDVAREVVEEGLKVILLAPNIGFAASTENGNGDVSA